jgi:hypothetical protein
MPSRRERPWFPIPLTRSRRRIGPRSTTGPNPTGRGNPPILCNGASSRRLLADGGAYDLIFDDDGAEKSPTWSRSASPKAFFKSRSTTANIQRRQEARVKDLYEICGKTQKSAHWREEELKERADRVDFRVRSDCSPTPAPPKNVWQDTAYPSTR